jgi:ligand-binding sensor domain-containing protein
MIRVFQIGLLAVLLFSCTQKNNKNPQLPTLYEQPESYQLNLDKPYEINPISGDSIETIQKTALGTTYQSGVEIPIIYKPINVPKNTIKLGPPNFLADSVAQNYKKATLRTAQLSQNESDINSAQEKFYLESINGDTIPSGVPVHVNHQTLKITPKVFEVTHPSLNAKSKKSILSFSEANGLPSEMIYDIIFDHEGNAWIGTGDVGLLKYDGHSVEQYSVEEGMRSEIIQKLLIDEQGDLWGATNGNGFFKFDGKVFTWWSVESGLPVRTIWDIAFDNEQNLWLTNLHTGLIKFDGKLFTFYTTNEGLPWSRFNSITSDNEGNIWSATVQNGIIKFDGEKVEVYNEKNGFPSNFINTLFTDSKGRLWTGTYHDGVSFLDNGTFHYLTKEDGLPSNYITDITEAQDGKIWISCYDGGIVVFDDAIEEVITVDDGLIDSKSYVLTFDEVQNLWIGSSKTGISIFRSNAFEFEDLKNEDGFYLDRIASVSVDSKGEKWYACGRSGLFHRTKDGYELYDKEQNLDTRIVRKVIHDHHDNLWFSDYNFTLNKMYGDSLASYDFSSLFSYPADKLFIDSKNNLWFSAFNYGLYKYDGESFKEITDSAGNSFPAFNNFTEDSEGNIWLSSYNSIAKISGESIIQYSAPEGMFLSDLLIIQCDENNDLWMGSYTEGVVHFDGEQFHYFNQHSGLLSNRVSSIVLTDSSVWVSTRASISCINRRQDKKFMVDSYNKEDGYQSLKMQVNEYEITDGVVTWIENGGFQKLDLNKLTPNLNVPVASFMNVSINGKNYDFDYEMDIEGISYSGTHEKANVPVNLVLSANNNHITFDYRAIEWEAPHKIRYTYRIKEIGEEWSKPSTKTQADYRGLSFGDYTFQLAAIGESQIWSEPIEFKFKILPPWYHTIWARIMYALISLSLLYAFMKWRTRKLEHRQKELEYEVELATTEIREQKRNVELQKDIIEEAHKEITDSIEYAKRIQSAILPHKKVVKQYLENSFILYKPKNIVAGDFYWMEHADDKVIFAAADCTGHGVPGAMVSVICHNALNRSVREYGLTDPGKILDKTREIVIEEFDKSEEDVKDGMDIALCTLQGKSMEFAGAHNPLWIIRNGELIEIKGDKQPIGKFINAKPFTTHQVELQKEDIVFVFSDGYADQFGGDKGKKMKASNFKKLLLSIQDKAFSDQERLIDEAFEEWKGDMEQLDDVCVIGVKI